MSVLSCRDWDHIWLPPPKISCWVRVSEPQSVNPNPMDACRRQKSKCKPNVCVLPGNTALSGLGNYRCTNFFNGIEGKICWSDEGGYGECSHWAAKFQQTIKGWAKFPPVLQVYNVCKHWWSENNKIIIIKRGLCLLFYLVSSLGDSSGNQSISPQRFAMKIFRRFCSERRQTGNIWLHFSSL